MRHPVLCAVALTILASALWMACAVRGVSGATPAALHSPTATVKANRQKSDQIRGFSLQLADPSPAAVEQDLAAVDEVAEMGCTWINFVISARQDNKNSEKISIMWEYTPSEKDIQRIIRKAKSRGMGVMLMPIVLLNNSGSSDWRGVIDPPSWDNWFAQYAKYITYTASLAQSCDVDIFCVGSELLSTEKNTAKTSTRPAEDFRQHWISVIKEVRKVFNGKLTYSANWDHYEVPCFWDQVDYIGMNNYNELGNASSSVQDLDKAWIPIKKKILDFVAKENKPFMFTEVGWHNLQNTIEQPWNYVAQASLDHGPQLKAYQSFVDTWGSVSTKQFMGAFVWEWRPGTTPDVKGTYSLQGTPSLAIVKQWMQSR